MKNFKNVIGVFLFMFGVIFAAVALGLALAHIFTTDPTYSGLGKSLDTYSENVFPQYLQPLFILAGAMLMLKISKAILGKASPKEKIKET